MPVQKMELNQMETLLQRQPVGRLGMSNNGQPYVVPLHYLYERWRIYFHSRKDGLKISCLSTNPKVCFEVDELIGISSGESACNFHTRYRSVLVTGTARILENTTEKAIVVNNLVEKYAEGKSFQQPTKEAIENVAIVEITVTEMTGKIRED
jgi:nitroimidazol reductase NimA-like FMN-containing flavoprotein (pyridoxamine 5'-phosphate oxidase superfamily)